MQTLSNMRRSSTYTQIFLSLLLFALSCIYVSLASMNVWIPPLIGVCFLLFLRFDKEYNLYSLLTLVVILMWIEANNNFPLGLLLGLFLILSFITNRIQMVFDSRRLNNTIYVILAYVVLYIGLVSINIYTDSSFTPSIIMLLFYTLIEIIIAMFL